MMNNEWIREAWTKNENGNWLPHITQSNRLTMAQAIYFRCCSICRRPLVANWKNMRAMAHPSCLDFINERK